MIKKIFGWFNKQNNKPAMKELPPVPTATLPQPLIQVSIINQCSVLSDEQLKPVVDALQIQVTRDFYPAFGINAGLTFVPKGQTPPPGTWWLVILDTSDEQQSLGYHDLTSEGLPIGKVFAKSDLDVGASWSVTISHELLELLGDPYINLCVFAQETNTTGKLYSFEVADSPEADVYGYLINGILVSDFVYPAWWGIPGNSGKLDYMDHVKQPLEILPGGYIGEFIVGNNSKGWTQKTSQIVTHPHRNDHKHGSRRERRIRGKENWKKSTAHS